jgi:hypothetical protein
LTFTTIGRSLYDCAFPSFIVEDHARGGIAVRKHGR